MVSWKVLPFSQQHIAFEVTGVGATTITSIETNYKSGNVII